MKGVFDMKRNIPIRVAGCLLIGTLLSTSMVSGTFAKYVVQDSATDSARVAKFGVVLKSSGNLFSDTYKVSTAGTNSADGNTPGKNTDELKAASLTVVSSSVTSNDSGNPDHNGLDGSDKVVAPGTKNTEGLTFSVTGTPEVAVKLTFEASGSDIWLGAGTYPNMTNGNTFNDTYEDTDTFTASTYYPIKYTLQQSTNGGSSWSNVDGCTGVTLKTIVDKLNGVYDGENGTVYDANTDLATKVGTYKLTWEWDYENQYSADLGLTERQTASNTVAKGAYDDDDTFMGDLAANKASVSGVVTTISSAAASAAAEKGAAATSLANLAVTDQAAITSASSEAAVASSAAAAVTMPAEVTSNLTAAANSYSINADFAITITVEQVD
jgi:hypothetical protein